MADAQVSGLTGADASREGQETARVDLAAYLPRSERDRLRWFEAGLARMREVAASTACQSCGCAADVHPWCGYTTFDVRGTCATCGEACKGYDWKREEQLARALAVLLEGE